MLNDINFEEIGSTINSLLLKFENNIKDKELISNILGIVDKYPSTYEKSQTLINSINKLDNDRFGHVQFLGYIVCSMKMESKVALETQLVFKDMFKMFSGSISLYIIVPFFVEFWKNKIKYEASNFRNIRKLEENLNKVKSLKSKFQTKAIFALISESLNYNLNQNDKEWLSDYYEEY